MNTIVFSGSKQKDIQANGAALERLSSKKPVINAGLADSIRLRFGQIASKDYIGEFQKKGIAVSGGGGTMGSGIALSLLNTGIPVALHDAKEKFVEGGVIKIQNELKQAVKRGITTEEKAGETLGRISGKYSNDTLTNMPKDTGMVIEAIFENPAAKKELFQKLDAHFGPDTILASNTSSLSIDEMAAATNRPDRVIGLHFFYPAHKNRFVEIIPGKLTSVETIEKTKALVRAMGKTVVICNDSPGFVANRMLLPLMIGGVKLWEREVAKAVDEYKALNNGQEPDIQTKADMERQYATTIEQAVKSTLWPTYSKKPEAAGILLGAFSGQNMPEYMGLVGDIAPVFQRGLGDAYAPAKTVMEKSAAFKALDRSAPDFQQKFDALKYKLGGPEDILQDKLQGYKDHFQGLVIGIATQLLDEGVTTPEDINRGVQIGTQWEISPFEMINAMGPRKALDLVRKYQESNPAFKVSEVLKTQAMQEKPFPLNYVQSHKEGDAQYITINKPQRNNSLDFAMLNNIEKAFKAAEADPSVKTIVFESIGGKHFVSGADIFAFLDQVKAKTTELKQDKSGLKGRLPKALKAQADQLDLYRGTVRPFLMKGYTLFNEISQSRKVTVAKVNGTALGGGAEIALACDYIVAGDEATFGMPETKYGLFPAWGGTERLSKRVGTSLATFMIMEGGLMSKGKGPAILNAQEAQSIGLVDRLADNTQLDQAVREGIADGTFTQKPKRQSGDKQDPVIKALLEKNPQANERLLAKLNRYQTGKLKEFVENELKPLYGDSPKARQVFENALSLAYKRVQRNRKVDLLTQEKEVFQMIQNLQATQRLAQDKSN